MTYPAEKMTDDSLAIPDAVIVKSLNTNTNIKLVIFRSLDVYSKQKGVEIKLPFVSKF